MEITEIKTHLTLAQVLRHYSLKPDKNLRLHCPFHDDKTPSMQVYYKTHTCYCFSSNCRTNGKSMDVIDFIMFKECWDTLGAEGKHRAIEKARIMVDGELSMVNDIGKFKDGKSSVSFDLTAFLSNMFTYFKNAVHNSKPAQEYIKQRGLDYEKLEVGYNSGQFHHGARKDETLIQNCLRTGLLTEYDRLSRTGEKAYQPFGKCCIVFALRNRANQVTGLYFRSTVSSKGSDTVTNEARHYYLKDRSGLYPHYPKAETEKLILTEAIIDSATLLQINPELFTFSFSLLTCFGTNGLTDEHITAIKELKNLKEIIFAFDNDSAGNKATEKYSKELKELLPYILISKLELPENEDINSVYLAHQPEIFANLLDNRIFLFSNEKSSIKKSTEASVQTNCNASTKHCDAFPDTAQTHCNASPNTTLNTKNPYKLTYTTETATYYIQGGISKIMDSMKVTLVIEAAIAVQTGHALSHDIQTGHALSYSEHALSQSEQALSQAGYAPFHKSRNKIDLYEDRQVEKLCREVSEKLDISKQELESDIGKLTDLLDEYREKEMQQDKPEAKSPDYIMSQQEINRAMEVLKSPGLIERLSELLGQAGIVGEENNRIFLFVSVVSHIMNETLHVLIQGTSGSGKTRQLRVISDCMPPERVIRLTRVSDKSFYNYPENYLCHKIISLEDVDGLSEEAEFAYRELVSNGELRSSISIKEENGKINSGHKIVKGPIASLACTTNGSIYEDNISRMFIVAVDESREQTQRIINYQNAKSAGKIDIVKENEIKQKLQHIVRMLKPVPVVNPYADKIHLPEEAHKLRRLNDLFKIFIHQITLINQYQRKKDSQGRLISTLQDIETAITIMFDSIVLKVDELDGSLRQFYEKLKEYIQKTSKDKPQEYMFTQREVRQTLGISKTQLFRYLNELSQLEYIRQSGGYANKGYTYKIIYWDDYKSLRERIKKHLFLQLENLKK